MRALVACLTILLLAGEVRAETPLSLETLLRSVFATHPKREAALAKIQEAKGSLLQSRAPFEPVISAAGSANPSGYYEHTQIQGGVQQRIPKTPLVLEGKYRRSTGDIAPYYGERETRRGGEISGRLKLPLLQGLTIDSERTAIAQAKAERKRATAELDSETLLLARDASTAYFEWNAAGQLLRVARELVDIAQERADTIGKQAEKGAIARIENVDAQRVLLSRQSELLKAQAEFTKAQQKLSLYYRSEAKEPLIAKEGDLPAEMPKLVDAEDIELGKWVERALARRPEFRALQAEGEKVRSDLRLAKNQRLPSLDLEVYSARDLGAGSPSLGQTDFGVGLALKFPVLQRKGRGKTQAARAKLAQISAKARGLRDKVVADIRQALALVTLREEQAKLARRRLEATKRLADAERTRLSAGASDILRVNLREKDVASAAKDAIDAELEQNRVLAEFFATVGDMPTARAP